MSPQRRRVLAGMAAGCALAFLFLAEAAEDAAEVRHVFSLDLQVQRLAQSVHEPTLGLLMRGFSWLGSGWGLVPLTGIVCALLWRSARRWAVFLLVTSAGSIGLEGLTKWLVARPRPNLGPYGFPSGHVLASVVVVGTLLAWLWQRPTGRTWRWLAAMAASLIVGGVAGSRLYLNAHWFTDVVGALTEGTAYLLGALLVLDGPPSRFRRATTPRAELLFERSSAWVDGAAPDPSRVRRSRGS